MSGYIITSMRCGYVCYLLAMRWLIVGHFFEIDRFVRCESYTPSRNDFHVFRVFFVCKKKQIHYDLM